MPDWNEGDNSYELPMFYSWNTGPVHFISLNTEYYYFLNYGATQLLRQYNWLINDLEEATLPENRKKQPWIVIFGHRPMYCSDSDKGSFLSKADIKKISSIYISKHNN